jgi:hypothetical protein
MRAVAASLLIVLVPAAHAEDYYIQPMIQGTSLPDLAGPGLRVKDGVIYKTYPGPMGIINPMGTTYKREGDELVPHTSILGPRDFEKPSFKIEDDEPRFMHGPFD